MYASEMNTKRANYYSPVQHEDDETPAKIKCER